MFFGESQNLFVHLLSFSLRNVAYEPLDIRSLMLVISGRELVRLVEDRVPSSCTSLWSKIIEVHQVDWGDNLSTSLVSDLNVCVSDDEERREPDFSLQRRKPILHVALEAVFDG